MELFLKIDTNIIAILMLMLVNIVASEYLERKDEFNRLFLRLSLLVFLQLILETITCLINERPVEWLILVSIILNGILFILAPVITSYWYILVRRLIHSNPGEIKKKYYIFYVPVLINFVLTVLSPTYHYVYYIDSMNVYHRGPLYLVSAFISFVYAIYGMFIIFIRRRNFPANEGIMLLIFSGLPVMGGLFQTIFYGPLLIWSCSAFSLVGIFIFSQKRMVRLDDLTGALARGSFDYYITQKIQQNYEKFGLIYVDLDKLKEINDNYGHMEGDFAIKTAVKIIRSEIRKNDIVVRMGGDEFLIMISCENVENLESTINRIEEAFERYNLNSQKEYRLECSLGADIFDSKNYSIDQFIHHVDNLMYQNKNKKRENVVNRLAHSLERKNKE